MLAVVLALAAAVSYSGSDYAAGLAARGASVVRVTVVAQVTNAVLLTPAVAFVSAGAPPPASLAWGAAAGVSGVVGTMALYLGFRHAAFSVASSVSAVGSAAFAVFAGLLFGERPGPLSLAGIASLYPAGTILLARLLLGERLTAVRIAGLCLAAASVSLIAAAGAG
jgi:drug/metabolite transporter (DMT)-like permease